MAKFNQWKRYGERKGESIIITNLGSSIKRGDTKYLRICKCGYISVVASTNICTTSGRCIISHKL